MAQGWGEALFIVRDDNLQGLLLDASGFQEKGGNECDGTPGLQQALPDSLTTLDR